MEEERGGTIRAFIRRFREDAPAPKGRRLSPLPLLRHGDECDEQERKRNFWWIENKDHQGEIDRHHPHHLQRNQEQIDHVEGETNCRDRRSYNYREQHKRGARRPFRCMEGSPERESLGVERKVLPNKFVAIFPEESLPSEDSSSECTESDISHEDNVLQDFEDKAKTILKNHLSIEKNSVSRSLLSVDDDKFNMHFTHDLGDDFDRKTSELLKKCDLLLGSGDENGEGQGTTDTDKSTEEIQPWVSVGVVDPPSKKLEPTDSVCAVNDVSDYNETKIVSEGNSSSHVVQIPKDSSKDLNTSDDIFTFLSPSSSAEINTSKEFFQWQTGPESLALKNSNSVNKVLPKVGSDLVDMDEKRMKEDVCEQSGLCKPTSKENTPSESVNDSSSVSLEKDDNRNYFCYESTSCPHEVYTILESANRNMVDKKACSSEEESTNGISNSVDSFCNNHQSEVNHTIDQDDQLHEIQIEERCDSQNLTVKKGIYSDSVACSQCCTSFSTVDDENDVPIDFNYVQPHMNDEIVCVLWQRLLFVRSTISALNKNDDDNKIQ